ncbi:MAG: FadR family transcriptional regulator [Deltaproteobacteria bacterium]|nr:FadR family transcriptional regulator [Deltaproteobacteria bacterium]
MGIHRPHLKVVRELVQRIYSGELKPGDKLPALTELIENMGVDQASTRIALKQLETMGVLEVRRSKGGYVKDFQKHAKIDFLATLFENGEEEDGEKFRVDPYLVDEIFEFWIMLNPEIIRMSCLKYTPRSMKAQLNIINEELENLGNVEKIVELEILSLELAVQLVDNIMLTMLMNSLRPVRVKLLEFLARSIDPEVWKEFLLMRKDMMKKLLINAPTDMDDYLNKFRTALKAHHMVLRKSIVEGDSF